MRQSIILLAFLFLIAFASSANAIWHNHYHYYDPPIYGYYGYPSYYCQPVYPYYYGGGGVSIRAPFTRINVGW